MSVVSASRKEPKPAAPPPPPPPPPPSPALLLFELEGVAVAGRKLIFEAVREALAKEGVNVTPALLARFGECPQPELYLADLVRLAGSEKAVTEKLTAAVNAAVEGALAKAELRKGFTAWLDEAQSRQMGLAAVSYLPEAAAQKLLDQLALAAMDVKLLTFKAVEKEFPRSESFKVALQAQSLAPRWLMAMVSSGAACHAALAVGAHCVAVPDEFTGFGDFGGADAVLEDLGDLKPAKAIDEMFPALRK